MMTKALVQGGASKVYIVGRRVDVLQAAAKTIDKPSVVVPLYCDVTSRVSLDSVMNIIQQDVGYLNLVVCNAGISGPQVPAPDPKTTTLEAWRDYNLAFNMDEYSTTMHVNTTSVWYTAMVMLKLLDQGNKKGNVEQSSQVVITGSVAAFNRKAPGGWAYGQSKAAASHIMRQLSVVLPTWNIRSVIELNPIEKPYLSLCINIFFLSGFTYFYSTNKIQTCHFLKYRANCIAPGREFLSLHSLFSLIFSLLFFVHLTG